MNTQSAPANLVTAPSLDMARPGDVIGLTRAFIPARRVQDVVYWRPITDSEPLPGNRHRVTVAGNMGGQYPMTMAPSVPIVLCRPQS